MHGFTAVVLVGRLVLLSEKLLAFSNNGSVVENMLSPNAVFCWFCVCKPLGGDCARLSDCFPVLLGCGCLL